MRLKRPIVTRDGKKYDKRTGNPVCSKSNCETLAYSITPLLCWKHWCEHCTKNHPILTGRFA